MSRFWRRAILIAIIAGGLGGGVMLIGGRVFWKPFLGGIVLMVSLLLLGSLVAVWRDHREGIVAVAEAVGVAVGSMGEPERRAHELAAVAEEHPRTVPSSIGVAFPLATAVVCGTEHVYNAATNTACPTCGQFDRLMLAKVLSPEILGPRLREAFGTRSDNS